MKLEKYTGAQYIQMVTYLVTIMLKPTLIGKVRKSAYSNIILFYKTHFLSVNYLERDLKEPSVLLDFRVPHFLTGTQMMLKSAFLIHNKVSSELTLSGFFLRFLSISLPVLPFFWTVILRDCSLPCSVDISGFHMDPRILFSTLISALPLTVLSQTVNQKQEWKVQVSEQK